MPRKIVFNVAPIVLNLSAPSFRNCAEELYTCAVSFKSKREFSPVPYMLLCQAIELKLKSHHVGSETQIGIKKFGHDLIKAYSALPPELKILSPDEYTTLEQCNAIYIDDKGFHYVGIKDLANGCRRFPELSPVIKITEKLLSVPTNDDDTSGAQGKGILIFL